MTFVVRRTVHVCRPQHSTATLLAEEFRVYYTIQSLAAVCVCLMNLSPHDEPSTVRRPLMMTLYEY